jgi:hypothetical protein
MKVERNTVNVSDAEKLSVVPVIFTYMKELTLEKNPMNVSSV